jgi:hypothetical protein
LQVAVVGYPLFVGVERHLHVARQELALLYPERATIEMEFYDESMRAGSPVVRGPLVRFRDRIRLWQIGIGM